MTGIRIARPGDKIRLNFPMRSTIHAVCCGTNLIIVFVGSLDVFWKYACGIPPLPPPPRLCPGPGNGFPGLSENCRRLQMAIGETATAAIRPLLRAAARRGSALIAVLESSIMVWRAPQDVVRGRRQPRVCEMG